MHARRRRSPVVEESEVNDRRPNGEIRELYTRLIERGAPEAARLLHDYPDEVVEGVLEVLNPASRQQVLDALPRPRRGFVLAAASGLPTTSTLSTPSAD